MPQPAPQGGGRWGAGAGSVLTGEVEILVEISNPWRHAAIIAARRMTHKTRDTGIDKIRACLSRDRSSAICSSAHSG